MTISVNLGKTTSCPRRVNMKMPEVQPATILPKPAVDVSVAVETMASMISWLASSLALAIPPATPRLMGAHPLPGFPPLNLPSESSRMRDPSATWTDESAAATGAA